MPRLLQNERERAVGMFQARMTQTEIANHFNCSRMTFYKLLVRVRATGTTYDRRRSGRPRKTTLRQDRHIVYKDDVYNAILLNIKYSIYTNRCLKKKLSFHSLKACLINLYKTEKMIAVRNQRIAEFQLHWSTFEKLFEDC